MLSAAPPSESLYGLYERACRWRGALDLFVDDVERISGENAWRSSLGIAASLARQGVAAGDRIAFLCKPSARHALVWFAAPLVGGVSCSMHIRETPERLAETLSWLEARVLVHDADLATLAGDVLLRAARAGHRATGISLGGADAHSAAWEDWLTAPAERLPSDRVTPDSLAAIILSSGSTGRPKGVMHTHRTLVENAKAGQALYGTITTRDATLVMMQPSFAAWVNVVVPYVAGCGKVVFGQAFTPTGFLASLERERITMAPAVPTMWRMMFAEDLSQFDLASVKIVSISGEPPSRTDLERIHAKVSPGIASFYSSSEAGTAGAVLATEADTLGVGRNAPGKPDTTGRPVVGADIRIINPEGSFDDVLPRGQIGEIAVSGPSLAIGYWRDEALTRERFQAGWWRSGDMGYIDTDGDLFVLGRTDNMINSGGMKVHGEEIERVLLRHPAVVQAAVVGMADERWGQRVEAHVILRSPGAVDAAGLEAFCRSEGGLASFKVPKIFHVVDRLPTGPTGKLYRRALRDAG
jgi:acyl-CoA synthetase (AMP-forming)/AMP-acid ligase II